MEEKLKQLNAKVEADKGLGEKIFSVDTAEAVQDILKAEGLDFSLEEIYALKAALAKSVQKGELSDDELEDVAGGIIVTAAVVGATASCLGASCGAAAMVHTVTSGRW